MPCSRKIATHVTTLLAALVLGACPGSTSLPSGDGPRRDGTPADARSDGPRHDMGASDLAGDVGAFDTLPADSTPTPDQSTLPPLWVYILAGQSNMVGLGINSELSSADNKPIADATIYYNDSIHPNTNTQKWLPLGPGFGVTETRYGPELGFGQRLRQLWPTRKLALIKVAEGGTALFDRWTAKTGDLYQLLISEAQAQLAVLRKSYNVQLMGMLWMQGESDAIDVANANAYQGRFSAFITAVRQDLGAPKLPVVAGLIAPQGGWPYATIVRNATTALSKLLPPMEVVETSDLPMHPTDQAHYNSASTLTLGRRFAEAAAAQHATEWHFDSDFGANQGNVGWSYRHRLGGDVQAMIFDKAQQRWTGTEAALLIGKGWMHPGPNREAELVFTARLAGKYRVDVTVQAGNNGGGDGTVVRIADATTLLWGPQAVPNNTTKTTTQTVTLAAGAQLFFRTSSGATGDNTYDTTNWTIDITPTP